MRRLTIDLMQTVGSILVLLLLTFSQEVRSEDLTALVTAANGKVAYYMENTKELQPVKVGTTRLTTGYVLMTGPNSRATLEIEGKHTAADSVHPEKTTVEIDAKSKVRMETLLTDVTTQGESVKLGVGQGRVICNVRKINTQSERFEVQTPTVVAAVRGTQFTTDVEWKNSKPNVSFNVTRGQIDLLDFRGTRLSGVGEGETADVGASGSVSVQPTGGGAKGSSAIDGRSGGIGGVGGAQGESETLSAPPSDDEGDDRGGN